MFKDYYKILGIGINASPQDVKTAYRNMSKKWHPDRNQGVDVTAIMQDINEAYTILKNEEKRKRYNIEYIRFNQHFKTKEYTNNSTYKEDNTHNYDYEVNDETLKQDINEARDYAKKLVDEFIKSFKSATSNATKGAWGGAKSYLYAFVVLSIIGSIIRSCVSHKEIDTFSWDTYDFELQESANNDNTNIVFTEPFQTPNTWTNYTINNSYSIAVPNTVELRNDYDQYTLFLKDKGFELNENAVIFQQKGLSTKPSNADQHYARIIIQHIKGEPDDFLSSNQTEPITYQLKSELKDIVLSELGTFSLLEEPNYQWIDINGIKALEIKYRRNGNSEHTTSCSLYLISNYDEFVKLMISYRESEGNLWLPDLKDVIKTFKWE